MPHVPAISESEWKIMKILWKRAPQPAYDIVQELNQTQNWHQNTVKTLLSRLHRKRALAVKKYKNLYLYSPLVSEEEAVHAEGQSFLDRVFGGAVRPMLVHFVKKQQLTRADIEELKRILKEKEK